MKARSMLFTLYGDSIQRYGGEIAAQSLIAVMGVLGFTPQAVRAALVRTVRQGWVQRRRVGRRSFYVLTPRGRLRVVAYEDLHVEVPRPAMIQRLCAINQSAGTWT